MEETLEEDWYTAPTLSGEKISGISGVLVYWGGGGRKHEDEGHKTCPSVTPAGNYCDCEMRRRRIRCSGGMSMNVSTLVGGGLQLYGMLKK
jgi:hypothetical protein